MCRSVGPRFAHHLVGLTAVRGAVEAKKPEKKVEDMTRDELLTYCKAEMVRACMDVEGWVGDG